VITNTTQALSVLRDLNGSFAHSTRPDGSTYWHSTTEDHIRLIYDMHNEELPNDWRYERIVSLVGMLLDAVQEKAANSIDELDLPELVADMDFDSLIDVYNYDLLEWAKLPGRLGAYEGYMGSKPTGDIPTQLQQEQRFCIDRMAHVLMQHVEGQCLDPDASSLVASL
jgi:hypothetical protein